MSAPRAASAFVFEFEQSYFDGLLLLLLLLYCRAPAMLLCSCVSVFSPLLVLFPPPLFFPLFPLFPLLRLLRLYGLLR